MITGLWLSWQFLSISFIPTFDFFKLVAFYTEFNLFTTICFVLFMIMDFPYICDHQLGHTAGEYSLSRMWFLTWYIYPFFQHWLHWWVLILNKTYDHWSVPVLKVTEHFIYSHFWFFSNWLLSALNSICLNPFVLFSLWWWISPMFVITKWSTLLVSIHFPWGGFLTWYIYPCFQDWLHCWVLILHKTYDRWSLAVLTVTELFIYSHFWFFSNWLLSAPSSICLPSFVLFSLW